jgi:hypothetical protein
METLVWDSSMLASGIILLVTFVLFSLKVFITSTGPR